MAHMEELDFGFQGFKRAGNACPAGYSLCPSQLGGGCCPSTLSCGISSCYGTMTSPLAACSSTGYVTCGVQEGGGCCLSGYQCDRNGCVAPAETSVSTAVASCDTGSFLCPASLNYGCCADGLSCGLRTCYETTTSTVPLTLTITSTNSASSVSTITTVVQTVYVPSTPTETETTSSRVAVSKIAASMTTATAKSTSSAGLTGSQRGGIIGGVVAGLLVVMLLAFMVCIILRRFSKAAPRASRYIDGPPNHPDHKYTGQTNDNPSEPLVPHEVHSKSVHRPTAAHHPLGKPWTNYVSPQNSPPFYPSNPTGYTPVVEYEPDVPNPHTNQTFSYFDHNTGSSSTYVSPPVDGRERSISFGQSSAPSRPSVTSHGRQWSDVSVQSHRSNQSNESYELDATVVERSPSIQQAFAGFKVAISRKHSRRKSSLSTRGPPDTAEWARSLQGKLDDVAEGQRPEDSNYGGSQHSQHTITP